MREIEIRIDKREGGYRVTLTGESDAKGLAPTRLADWEPGPDPDVSGMELFRLLLSSEPLLRAWYQYRGGHERTPLKLRIDMESPELHALPWELLCEPVPDARPRPLAASAETPFCRYLPSPNMRLGPISERPIHMVVAIANPSDLQAKFGLAPIDIQRERDLLRQALSGVPQEHLKVTWLEPPVTLSALDRQLGAGCHVLHLISHGRFVERAQPPRAGLYLEDEQGRTLIVDENEFQRTVQRQGAALRLLVLAGCETATRDDTDALRGLAPRLVTAGVPAVVAMQEAVPVATAQSFSRAFYEGLFRHGYVDQAANAGRSAILAARLPGSHIPVLFSRLEDNQLFTSTVGSPHASQKPHRFRAQGLDIPDLPYLTCDRDLQWSRLESVLGETRGSHLILLPGPGDHGHEHFLWRVRRDLERKRDWEIAQLRWQAVPPRNQNDYREALARALDCPVEELQSTLQEILDSRNLAVLHPCVNGLFDDPALLDYYTRTVPELVESAGGQRGVKLMQPIAWVRRSPLERALARLVSWLPVMPRWAAQALGEVRAERLERELRARLQAHNGPRPHSPLTLYKLPLLDEIRPEHVREFCKVKGLEDEQLVARFINELFQHANTPEGILKLLIERLPAYLPEPRQAA